MRPSLNQKKSCSRCVAWSVDCTFSVFTMYTFFFPPLQWYPNFNTTNPTIYNIICWLVGKRLHDQASDIPSIFFIIFHRLSALKTPYFHFCNFIKNQRVFPENFARFYEKEVPTWNIRHLAQGTSKSYCRLTDITTTGLISLILKTFFWLLGNFLGIFVVNPFNQIKNCCLGNSHFRYFIILYLSIQSMR